MARRKTKGLGLGGTLIVAVLIVLAYFIYPYLMPESTPQQPGGDVAVVEGEVSVHVIDVGQGDAILLLTPDGSMLIDAGENTTSSETALKNYLNTRGITTLDYFVVSHNHEDHIGGADMILRDYDVKNVVMTDAVAATKVYGAMLDALEQSDANVIEALPDLTFSLGDLNCRVLAPLKEYSSNTNDQSIVLRATYGKVSMMFTGDAEGNSKGKSEKDIVATYSPAELQSDFYKAGHHGSDTSSSTAFLQAVRPKIAAISCGEGNSYGHPFQSVLDTLDALGVQTYRTDRQGDLVFVCDGEIIEYRS